MLKVSTAFPSTVSDCISLLVSAIDIALRDRELTPVARMWESASASRAEEKFKAADKGVALHSVNRLEQTVKLRIMHRATPCER